MKKTLTVNLGGTVFHIDEDAYELLDKYLSNLRVHFNKEDGSDEIMGDFEMRISELLNERIRLGYNVITVTEIEEVIARMGKPEEIFDEEEEPKFVKEEHKTAAATAKKRFFRNPDDRILGGVAGGIAAYMGWDPTAVRIILLLLIFFQITIPIYLVLWLIVPLARTASEKLQMRGEVVTVENIGKTVTDGFEKMSNHVNDYISSDRPRTAAQKFADGFVSVIGVILKIFAVLLGIIIFPPLLLVFFVLIIVFFAVIIGLAGGGFGLLSEVLPFADWGTMSGYPEAGLVLSTITSILSIGIPLFSLIYIIGAQAFKWKPLSTGIKWTLLILWLASILLTAVFAHRYGFPVIDGSGWHWSTPWDTSFIRFW